MTTIAYRNGIIAFDSRVTAGDIIESDSYIKQHSIGDSMFFFTGSLCDVEELAGALKNDTEYKGRADADAFVVMNGEVVEIEARGNRIFVYPVKYPRAIGSGAVFALAAMDFGKSAVEAVRYAATRDCRTGGEIREFKIS